MAWPVTQMQKSVEIYIISQIIVAFWLVLIYDLLEDRLIDDCIYSFFFITIIQSNLKTMIKQIDSMLSCSDTLA